MGIFNFGRITNWISLKNLTATALNNEFNNLFTNLAAPTISGAAGDPATLTGMRATENPGTEGSEILPVTIQDDIRELRYQTNAIIGLNYWYDTVPISLTQISEQLNSLIANQPTRIVDGKVSTAGQPEFLLPTNASANGVTLNAFPSRFDYYVQNTLYTQSSNLSISSLSTAPSNQNTCVVNDAAIPSGTGATLGSGNSIIQITTLGTNISALNGKYAAFKAGSEYFVGQVITGSATPVAAGLGVTFLNAINVASHGLNDGDQAVFSSVTGIGNPITSGNTYFAKVIDSDNFYITATIGGPMIAVGVFATTGYTANVTFPKVNRIQNCFRGYFFDNTGTWIPSAALTNGETITLMRLTWVFLINANTTPSIAVTYNQPIISNNAPTGASIGDYWLSPSTGIWAQYNGASFQPVNGILLGLCCQDATYTVGARSLDFNNSYQTLNTFSPGYLSSTQLKSTPNPKISVYGTGLDFTGSTPTFDTSLISGGVQASTTYYCYVSPLGQFIINSIAPYDRNSDLLGYYEPDAPNRCVAQFTTDGSTNIIQSSVIYAKYHQPALPPAAIDTVNIKNNAVGTQQMADLSITPKKLSAIPYILSGSSGSYTSSSTSEQFVTNLLLTSVPVIGNRGITINFQGATNSDCYFGILNASGSSQVKVRLYIGVSIVQQWDWFNLQTNSSIRVPPNYFNYVYIPTSDSTATVSLAHLIITNGTFAAQNVQMVVRQL